MVKVAVVNKLKGNGASSVLITDNKELLHFAITHDDLVVDATEIEVNVCGCKFTVQLPKEATDGIR
jgi:hypothetical protein